MLLEKGAVLGRVVRGVAIDADPRGAALITGKLLLHVASATEIVELGLDERVHLWVGLVAIEAESLPGSVEEVVVAQDAVFGDVIGVSEGEGEQWARGAQAVLTERHEHCPGRHRGDDADGRQQVAQRDHFAADQARQKPMATAVASAVWPSATRSLPGGWVR